MVGTTPGILMARRRITLFLTINALIYFITFGILLPYFCQSWPYSTFFIKGPYSELYDKATSQNDARNTMAESFFSKLNPEKTLAAYKKQMNSSELAIMIITTFRNDGDRRLKYLFQTTSEMHKQIIKNNDFRSISLQLCDVHRGVNEDAESLAEYFHIVKRYPKNVNSRGERSFRKETSDYAFCLQNALNTGAQYILMLEDDAVPLTNMLSTLKHIITHKLDSFHSKGNMIKKDRNWFYLNLFFPQRWQGFSKDLDDYRGLYLTITEITGWASLGSGLFCLAMMMLQKRLFKTYMSLILLSSFAYIALFVFLVGRQHLLELSRFSKHLYKTFSPARGCCTPAIVLQRDMAVTLIGCLTFALDKEQSNEPIDILMARCAREKRLQTFGVEPNLVTHVGMISSVKKRERVYAEEFVDLKVG